MAYNHRFESTQLEWKTGDNHFVKFVIKSIAKLTYLPFQYTVDASHANTTEQTSANSTHVCYLFKNYYPITVYDEEVYVSSLF
jgi:hypothetical protein